MAGPLGTHTNTPQPDADTMCRGRAPTPGPVCIAAGGANSTDLSLLDELLNTTRWDVASLSGQVINDAPVRQAYMQEVERGIAEIRLRFSSRSFESLKKAATEANKFRNDALESMRMRT